MATEQTIAELVEKMGGERAGLLAVAEAFSEEDAGRPNIDAEGEAQWSVKEQLAHLALMENAYRGWVQRGLAEENPDVTSMRPEMPPIGLPDANSHTVAELVQQLKDLRAETLEVIDGMAPDDFERTATQGMFGTLTLMQWLRSYYRHDRMHRAQILGEEGDYKPRFVGGAEPDQRLRRPSSPG
jgi:hypothetical protein